MGHDLMLIKKYRLLKPIGHGAYGVVVSAENTETKQKVAIKKITKAFDNLMETKRTLREIKILRHFRHENIIEVLDILRPDSYEKFDDVYLVSELMNTDLHQIIASNQPLTDEHVQYFIYQILRGLKYIHSCHVIHRDIKPSNLLLNANCDLKICDFGLARIALDKEKGFLTEYVATRWYRAPEIMLSWKEYTKAIDVWSVGCVFAEILARKPLFPGKDYMHQLMLILDVLGTPSYEDTEYIRAAKPKQYIRSLPIKKKKPFKQLFPKASDLALDLLERMLAFVPEKRITVDEALAHPYLKMLHDPNDEPVSDKMFTFDFEQYTDNPDALRALLWQEACEYHPDLKLLSAPSPEQFFKKTEKKVAPTSNNSNKEKKVIITNVSSGPSVSSNQSQLLITSTQPMLTSSSSVSASSSSSSSVFSSSSASSSSSSSLSSSSMLVSSINSATTTSFTSYMKLHPTHSTSSTNTTNSNAMILTATSSSFASSSSSSSSVPSRFQQNSNNNKQQQQQLQQSFPITSFRTMDTS
eukprot:TRINITY_DN2582_c0_g1_i1.p1 TRINITY_DN2582_c0_g1~~TRINITY_DN2582_c0_g1_i1.p1  ORF type:complete len:527 (-),score=159.82 TRINITY_DN2582_c0_g1_i1:95-1675(-)